MKRALIFAVVILSFLTACECNEPGEWSAKIELKENSTVKTAPAAVINIPLVVTNLGSKAWNSTDKEQPVYVSYHILDAEGNMQVFDNRRTSLPAVVAPDNQVELALQVETPAQAGKYQLEIDLVKEGFTWFKERGSATTLVSLEISGKPLSPAAEPVAKPTETPVKPPETPPATAAEKTPPPTDLLAEILYEGETTLQSLPSSVINIPLTLTNMGNAVWDSADKEQPVYISYHLLDREGKMLVFDNKRTLLPWPVKPKEQAKIYLQVESPAQPGTYQLEVDVVKENVTWFKERGMKTAQFSLTVEN